MAGNIKIKIILLGDSGVGKTSVLLRFKSGEFKENTRNTFIDHHIKSIKVRDREVNLNVWDTAGQEQFRSIVRSYYREADGVLLLYDVTNVATFHILTKWLSDIRSNNERAQILIVGNKNEDPAKKSVAISTVKTFAREEGLQYMEASAKSGANVDKVFHHLTEKILIEKGILPRLQENISPSEVAAPAPTDLIPKKSIDPEIDSSENDPPYESIKLHNQPSEAIQNTTKKGGCC